MKRKSCTCIRTRTSTLYLTFMRRQSRAGIQYNMDIHTLKYIISDAHVCKHMIARAHNTRSGRRVGAIRRGTVPKALLRKRYGRATVTPANPARVRRNQPFTHQRAAGNRPWQIRHTLVEKETRLAVAWERAPRPHTPRTRRLAQLKAS
jgi:hypothetical protein